MGGGDSAANSQQARDVGENCGKWENCRATFFIRSPFFGAALFTPTLVPEGIVATHATV